MNETSYYRGAGEAEDAMAVTARWISGNEKIKVVYHTGNAVDADVEKGVIRIPRMACASGITQEVLMLLRSRVYHEAGHIDESVAVAKKDYPKEKSLFNIWNALEDRRMEAVEAEKHQGCKVVFKWANEYYNRDIAGKVMAGEVDAPLWEAMVAMSFMVEGLTPLWKLSKKANAYVEASYGKFMKVKQCADSKDSLELAREIYEILKKKNEEMKKEQEKKEQEKGKSQKEEGDGEGDENGEQGESSQGKEKKDGEKDSEKGDSDFSEEGKDEKELEEKDEEGKGGEGEEQDGDSEEGDKEDGKSSGAAGDFEDEEEQGEGKEEGSEEGEGKEEGSEEGEGKGEGSEEGEGKEGKGGEKSKASEVEYECRDEELEGEQGKLDKRGLDEELEGISKEEMVKEKLEKLFKDIDPCDQYISRRDMDVHEVPDGSDKMKAIYKKQRDEVSSAVAGLTQALQQALRSMAKSHKKPYLRQGKIDRKRLVAISKGLSKEVFFRVKEGIELDVAVSIVIDESGSMRNSVEETRKTAMAMCEALDAIGVPFEVTGSSTTGWGGELEDGFDRTNPVLYRHYKTFGENWGSVRQRIVNSSSLLHNVDGEFVEYAAFRLAQRKESRKVIFSLSDGRPEAGHGNDKVMAANLKRVCARARKAGIEVYGFGIKTSLPEDLYEKKYFVELDGDGMGAAFVKRVSDVVTGGLVKV